jgi:hypothetical protein
MGGVLTGEEVLNEAISAMVSPLGDALFVTLSSRDSMKITVKACQSMRTQSAL